MVPIKQVFSFNRVHINKVTLYELVQPMYAYIH